MVKRVMGYVKKAWAPTLVVTIVFFLQFFIFGSENTTIAPFVALTFLRIQNKDEYSGCLIRNFGVYCVMAVGAYIALLHPICSILVNACLLFWIAYFLIDEFMPNNYFPAGMALIFFQIAPAEGIRGLGMRIGALVTSFLVVLLFEWLLRKWIRHRTIDDYVREALAIQSALIDAMKSGDIDAVQKTQTDLCAANRVLCNMIYHDNRAHIGKVVAANQYCTFIWALRMSVTCAKKWESEQNEGMIREIEKLHQDLTVIQKSALGEDISLEARLIPYVTKERLHFRVNKLDMRSFRLRFALRQVCVMTPCLFYGYMVKLPNAYWLAISVFFMMIPLYERTFGRIAERMKGTLAGLTICIVLFAVFQTVPERIIIMTIFNFMIYCSGSYTAMVTCITCSALALNFTDQNYLIILLWRLGYTIFGAFLAWIANTAVFPIRAERQMDYIRECFDNIYKKKEEVQALPEAQRVHWMNRLLVRAYLFANRLEDLNQALPQDKAYGSCKEYLEAYFEKLIEI